MSTQARPRVLVVDDVATNRKLLADLVAMEGCEAVVACGGAEALAMIVGGDIDLVFLDIMMPDIDGMEVLAELQARKLLPALPVVMVTALEDRKARLDALAAGAIDFLSKPIDRAEVACKLRTLLELKRLRVTALRTAEDALRESEHRLRLRFLQSPVAEIEWSTDFRVAGWNPAAEELFGYLCDEALDQQIGFILGADQRSDVLLSELDGPWKSTSHNLTKGGRTIICEWYNAPLKMRDGTPLGISSIVIDVTERERLQEALVQTRKMDAIGKLAGGIAHDFNNILAVILSYASFIRDELSEGDTKREDIIEVLKAADRAAALTKQLLTFSRQQPTVKKRQNLNENLLQLQKFLSRSVGAHIDLTVEPALTDAVVLIDPVQFDQIVLNLAINARDAMPDGGWLRIGLEHASERPGRVLLKVADNGKGMDAATQARIFEPFFTTKEESKGTGLGLATSFGIVADAGGTFRVESSPGEGTTFMVELPLCEGAADAGASKVAPPQAGRGETILVVEDEPGLRRVATRVLEGAGYRVHEACDGNEAMKCIEKMGPQVDLVLSDVMMPGCGGYDVVAYTARNIPGTPVLLMSGYFERTPRRNYRPDLPVLWKPVSPAELVRAVASALAARAQSASADTTATEKVILLVDDDVAILRALGRLLERAGYATQRASSVAEAREIFESGVAPWLVLCDLSLPDGSGGEFLGWVRDTQPALHPRLYLLTGGAVSQADRQLVARQEFQVLNKSIDPRLLVELVNQVRDAQPAE